MIIPASANNRIAPITRNIPLDLLGAKSYWKKFKLWKWGIPKEILEEDFYQILPRSCNEWLGFSKDDDVCCFIPKTFVFNGASIPKALSSLYLPTGILYIGAFHHDFLYNYGGLFVFTEDMDEMKFVTCNQKTSDKIFYEINEEVNKFKTATYPAYRTLRMVGSVVWNKCRKNEEFTTHFISNDKLMKLYIDGGGK